MSTLQEGTKHDGEKIQLDLLSARWLFGVGQVLTFGARKYAAYNWRKGIKSSRLLGACLRHVLAYLGGEDNDPETGICHLYHASCCLMFASELAETKPEFDDRYREHDGPRPMVDGARLTEEDTYVQWACFYCYRVSAVKRGNTFNCYHCGKPNEVPKA